MNNIVSNFNQILDFAKKLSAPVEKRRAVIREFLQTKFITTLYTLPKSNKLSFVGGTSLRILRDLNRFSEDLDFDNLGLTEAEIIELMSEVVRRFKIEGINLNLTTKTSEKEATYLDIRFPNLLKELKISSDPSEKLMIKVDYANLWKDQETEAILLRKYGFIETIITNVPDQILVQKITAYVRRNITQPRDIYDIVWLYSQGAEFDLEFAEANGVKNILNEAINKFEIDGVTEVFKRKLTPFLFDPEDAKKIDLLLSVLTKLKN